MENLRGQLLLSGGSLYDPNFRQTVVLVAEHGPEGALGVVLNRPLGVSVAESVPPLAPVAGEGAVLFEGGPVQREQPLLLAELALPTLADVLIFGSVGFLTGEVTAAVRPGILRARVFAGYAGWGAGQLEAEMEQDSWILEPATEEDVFTAEPESLWRRVLERKGPPFARLARIPFDPTLN